MRPGSSAAARRVLRLYKFLQPGIYAYVTHNLIEAVELGATAHFKVEGKWNDDLMTQVKAPSEIPAAEDQLMQHGCRPQPAPSLFESSTAMLIAFKLKLALACAAGLAGPLAMAPLLPMANGAPALTGLRDPNAIVEVQRRHVVLSRRRRLHPQRQAGGSAAGAGRASSSRLSIMKHQVSCGRLSALRR